MYKDIFIYSSLDTLPLTHTVNNHRVNYHGHVLQYYTNESENTRITCLNNNVVHPTSLSTATRECINALHCLT